MTDDPTIGSPHKPDKADEGHTLVDTSPASHLPPRHDAGLNRTEPAQTETTLAYESSIPGTLQPGERVLFECRPEPAVREPLAVRLGLVAALSVMVAFAVGAVWTSAALAALAAVAGVVAAILIGASVFLGGEGRRGRRELSHQAFRVTDRRVVCVDDRPGRPPLEVHASRFDQLRVIRHGRAGGATVTVGAAAFTPVPDAARFERAVIDLVARSGRRRHVRRMPSHDTAASRINAPVVDPPQPDPTVPDPTLADGFAPAADERVLWAGRPRVAEPLDRAFLLGRLHILAWLLVPLGFLLAALGALEPWVKRVHVFFGFLGAFLLLAGLYSLLVAPFVRAYRRSRTAYVLTNVRAVVCVRSLRRGSVTDSYLLDMAGMTELREHSDGAGDVWISSGSMFERIERPREVHALVLDAVRHAGTPLAPSRDDDESF